MIDDVGNNHGVVATSKALMMAQDKDLDLVLVSPNQEPPVAKILDYGKYKYEMAKRAKEAKKKQKVVEVKEIKIRYKIDVHDYNVRIKSIKKFIAEGNKVKIVVMLRGREMQHSQLAYDLAEKYDAEVIPVQHHHAHSVALANDHSIDEMIVIAADGVGYGSDATSWGGEILYTDITSFERLGHLQSQLMPGGDMATRYPARMLASILNDGELIKDYSKYFKYGEMEIKNLFKQLDAGINVGKTTSTGRVLDSMAVALEIAHERTYEGECSMKLESCAYYSTKNLEIPYIIEDNVLNTTEILKQVVKLYKNGEKKADVANAGQNAVAKGLAELAVKACDKKRLEDIGATGGVFYNEAITDAVKNSVKNSGYNFIEHINTCAGDGSVSLGQAIVAKKQK